MRADVIDSGSTTYLTSYAYNDAELLATISSNLLGSIYFNQGIVSFPYIYDADGRIASVTKWGQVTTWTWNPDNTLAERIIPPQAPSTTPITDWTYTYDSSYRLLHAGFTGLDVYTFGAVSHSLDYGYDSAGRVTSFNDGTGAKAATYDHDGNRLTYGSQSFTYNADDSGAKAGYAYLAFGGLQTDGCSNYAYDGFDRLHSVTPTNGTGCSSSQAVTYAYDGLDRQKTVTTTFATPLHYDGLSQTTSLEKDPYNQDLPFVLGPNGDRVAVHFWIPPGGQPAGYDNPQLLEGDGRGNISTVWEQTESGIAPDCQIFFDPWGVPAAPGTPSSPCSEGSTYNSYFYHGARLDSATGDYQLGSRTYDPTKASFLMPDTFRASQSSADVSVGVDPLTRNRYAYVNGDPVNLIDPTGHDGCSWNPWSWGTCVQQATTAVTGAVSSTVSDVVSAVSTDVTNAATAGYNAVENYISSQFDQISSEFIALYNATNAAINAFDSILVPTLQTVLGTNATDTGSNDPVSQIQRAARHTVIAAAKTDAVLVTQARPVAVAATQATAQATYAAVDSCQQAGQSLGNAAQCGLNAFQIASTIVLPEGGEAVDLTVQGAKEFAPDAEKVIQDAVQTCVAAHSFAAGTLVLMADGSRKPIEQVKIGDKVEAEDPLTHKSKAEAVEAVWDNTNPESWVEINVGSSDIKVTQEHPFWLPSQGGWAQAGNLKIGEQLLTFDGSTVTISGVAHFQTLADHYNLTVHELHTYFASQSEVLVHNCEVPSNLPEQLAMEQAQAGFGRPIIPNQNMWDLSRIVANYGPGSWEKWEYVLRNGQGNAAVVVHYLKDPASGAMNEFKFTKRYGG